MAGDVINFVYPWKFFTDQGSLAPTKNLELLDIALFFYPEDCFLNHSLKMGEIPLWNPNKFCGLSWIASGQSAVLYWPKLIAHYFLEPAQGRTVLLWLHLQAMGTGAIFWFRSRQFSRQASLVGAIVWCFNALSMSMLEHEFIPVIFAYLFPCLFCVDQVVRHRKAHYLFPLGFCSGVFITGGHVQYAAIQGFTIAAYAVYGILSQKNYRAAAHLSAAACLGIGVSCTTGYPVLELLSMGQRVQFSWAELQQQTTSLASLLLTLCGSEWLGNPTENFLVNRCSAHLVFNEFACYVGFLPLLLILGQLACDTEEVAPTPMARSEQIFWLSMAGCCLLAAAATPLYFPVYLIVPMAKKIVPSRVVQSLVLALTVLSAQGVELLDQEKFRRRTAKVAKVGLATWVLVLLTAIYLFYVTPSQFHGWLQQTLESDLWKLPSRGPEINASKLLNSARAYYLGRWFFYQPLLTSLAVLWLTRPQRTPSRQQPAQVLVLACLVADLLPFGIKYNTTTEPRLLFPLTAGLQKLPLGRPDVRYEKFQCLTYNCLEAFQCQVTTGYDSVMPLHYYQLMQAIEPTGRVSMRAIGLSSPEPALFDALNVEYAVAGPHYPPLPADSRFQAIYRGEIQVYQNKTAMPRLYLANGPHWSPDWQQTLLTLGKPEYDPHRQTLLEARHSDHNSIVLPNGSANDGHADQLRILSYQANQVQIDCDLSQPRVVVLADSEYPGWHATDESGRELPILRAHGLLRAIVVGAGHHKIRFQFWPSHFTLLCSISALSVSTCLAGSLILLRQGLQPKT